MDLLFRLGVPGIWDRWDSRLKDLSMKRPSKDFGSFITVSHVWRLPSGSERAESHLPRRREDLRKRGIVLLMNKIDKMTI